MTPYVCRFIIAIIGVRNCTPGKWCSIKGSHCYVRKLIECFDASSLDFTAHHNKFRFPGIDRPPAHGRLSFCASFASWLTGFMTSVSMLSLHSTYGTEGQSPCASIVFRDWVSCPRGTVPIADRGLGRSDIGRRCEPSPFVAEGDGYPGTVTRGDRGQFLVSLLRCGTHTN